MEELCANDQAGIANPIIMQTFYSTRSLVAIVFAAFLINKIKGIDSSSIMWMNIGITTVGVLLALFVNVRYARLDVFAPH